MGLLPNIGPLDSSFPLFGTPRLRIVARGEGVPIARSDAVLEIEATNLAPRSVGVASIHVGYRYTNALSEAALGKRAPELPLRELFRGPSSPATLAPGESVVWTASLGQLAAEARAKILPPDSHQLFLEPASLEPVPGWDSRFGRFGVAIDNTARAWTHRRLAVVVRDEEGALYKTKVRWLPPGGAPPDPRVPSSTQA
jgi:hypothetical protein